MTIIYDEGVVEIKTIEVCERVSLVILDPDTEDQRSYLYLFPKEEEFYVPHLG